MVAKKTRMGIFHQIAVIPMGPNIVIRYVAKNASWQIPLTFNLHFDELFIFMHFSHLCRKRFLRTSEKESWKMPGTDTTQLCLRMAKQVLANPGLWLVMVKIRELFPCWPTNFSLGSGKVVKARLLRSNCQCWKSTMKWLVIYLMPKVLGRNRV